MDDELLNWNKLKENATKIGFRDGVDQGRESNFQSSFDQGYKNGYRNGFALGKLKAQLKDAPELKNTKQGNCYICNYPSVTDKTIEEIQKLQWVSTQNLISSKNDTK